MLEVLPAMAQARDPLQSLEGTRTSKLSGFCMAIVLPI